MLLIKYIMDLDMSILPESTTDHLLVQYFSNEILYCMGRLILISLIGVNLEALTPNTVNNNSDELSSALCSW